MENQELAQKLQAYIEAKQKYEDQLKKIEQEIYRLETEKQNLETELQNEFGTTDIESIQKIIDQNMAEIVDLEKKLETLVQSS